MQTKPAINSVPEKHNCDTGVKASNCFYGDVFLAEEGKAGKISMRMELC